MRSTLGNLRSSSNAYSLTTIARVTVLNLATETYARVNASTRNWLTQSAPEIQGSLVSSVLSSQPPLHQMVLGLLDDDIEGYLFANSNPSCVNVRDSQGRTALWWSCRAGNLAAVEQLFLYFNG